MSFRILDESTFVFGQVQPAQMVEAARLGIGMIVNNRPDGEEAGQPSSAEMEEAALTAGLDYRYIPVAGGFSANQVTAMAEALDAAEGKTLAFCRSGTRSTFLWALARAQQGIDGEELMRQAAKAGYDLAPIQMFLTR